MRLHITIDGPVTVAVPGVVEELRRTREILTSIDASLKRIAETAQEPPETIPINIGPVTFDRA